MTVYTCLAGLVSLPGVEPEQKCAIVNQMEQALLNADIADGEFFTRVTL